MEQEQVLRKVRKLLRLGDSPNVNEAALAKKECSGEGRVWLLRATPPATR